MGQINKCSCWVWKQKSAKFVILTNVVNSHHACNITQVTYVRNLSYISSLFEPKPQCFSSPNQVLLLKPNQTAPVQQRKTMLIYVVLWVAVTRSVQLFRNEDVLRFSHVTSWPFLWWHHDMDEWNVSTTCGLSAMNIHVTLNITSQQ